MVWPPAITSANRDGLVLRVHGAKASRARVMLQHAPGARGASAGRFDAPQQRRLLEDPLLYPVLNPRRLFHKIAVLKQAFMLA
jgi:hypothetical protein